MGLPQHAPPWASPLVEALSEAGFVVDGETRGSMAGYLLDLRRGECLVTLGGDRGDFFAYIELPNPHSGRGQPRRIRLGAEDYMAAERGDTDASFLLSDTAERTQAVADWLAMRVGGPALALNGELLQRIRALQQLRGKALFGNLPTEG